MAMGWLALDALEAEEEADALEELGADRRRLRDQQDPFRLPEVQFRQLYRLSRELASDLVDQLRPHLERDRETGFSVESQNFAFAACDKFPASTSSSQEYNFFFQYRSYHNLKLYVLCAVRFYAVGSYQRAVGQDFMIAMSQTSVSRCLKSVTDAINDHLFRPWVYFPATPRERDEARQLFAHAPQPFQGAIGAIDCTHIAILAPSEHEEAYVNHHGYHSLNVQIICDPTLKILNLCARFPGSRHDAAIWMQSPVRMMMEMCYGDGERGTWLLGDSGYPLEPWLMTPITHAEEGTPEFAYTQAHCKARSAIERCNGVLKVVWRCLSQQRVLMYDPTTASRIVNACVTLHNMRLHYRLPDHEDDVHEAPAVPAADPVPEVAEPLEAGERLAEARRVRDEIILQRFAG